jgi:hypothetical protein
MMYLHSNYLQKDSNSINKFYSINQSGQFKFIFQLREILFQATYKNFHNCEKFVWLKKPNKTVFDI